MKSRSGRKISLTIIQLSFLLRTLFVTVKTQMYLNDQAAFTKALIRIYPVCIGNLKKIFKQSNNR